MPGPSVVFRIESAPSLRGIGGKFEKATDNLVESAREEMRNQGRRYVTLAKEEAPKDKGDFAEGIRFRSFEETGPGGTPTVGFDVTTPQPLGLWIIGGTEPHAIPVGPTGVYFFWENAPAELGGPGNYYFAQVQHPGTKPNRFHERAYETWLPGGREAMLNLASGFTSDLDTLVGS